MRIRGIAVIAGLVAAFAAAQASAEDFSQPGVYVGINGVAGIPGGSRETGVGGSFRFGYRFASRFALETQVEYGGKFESGPFEPDLHEVPLTLNARYAFTDDRFQPYALLGVGAIGAYRSTGGGDTAAVVRIGGGAEVYINEHFGVMLEATQNLATDERVHDYTSIGWGLFVRF